MCTNEKKKKNSSITPSTKKNTLASCFFSLGCKKCGKFDYFLNRMKTMSRFFIYFYLPTFVRVRFFRVHDDSELWQIRVEARSSRVLFYYCYCYYSREGDHVRVEQSRSSERVSSTHGRNSCTLFIFSFSFGFFFLIRFSNGISSIFLLFFIMIQRHASVLWKT